MWTTKSIFALTLATVCALYMISPTSACSCMPSHPQETYCNADYVIVARILSRRAVQNHRFVYKIDIRKEYKMSEKAHHYLKHGRIFSAGNDGMCGIDFKLGELYLIAGSSPNVGICNYVKQYSKMTLVEKRGVAGGYKKGCECKINYGYNNLFESRNRIGGCEWKGPWNECETDFGVCVPSRGYRDANNKPTKCHWRRSNPYMACIRDP
ncbi:tissue inhibitor of metalloproteinase [Culicoides brevitarsis]|uniref:tissue inhibitor of metalloproteinase n=1 Tax=Culicoides brevitarsis TaxID=469753 RepID=UPI00307B3EE7